MVWEHRSGTGVLLDVWKVFWGGGECPEDTGGGHWDCLGTPVGYWDFSLRYWGVLLGRGLETLGRALGHP